VRVQDKDSDAVERAKVGATGVIVHGRYHYAFISGEEWPKDSNMTIEILQRVLSDLEFESGKPLPRVMYLQMDNTSRYGSLSPYT
jgi:hypothetical protein